MFREIRLSFDAPESFLAEFERSLAHGVAFIATADDFDLREAVYVTLALTYCRRSVAMLGAVTSRITASLAAATGGPEGIVIEFVDRTGDLQKLVDETIGGECPPSPNGEQPPFSRSPRLDVALDGELVVGEQRIPTRTQNLSRSGVLLEVSGVELEVGHKVSLSLVDPSTGDLVAASGKVVREEKGENGEISAVALELDGEEKQDEEDQQEEEGEEVPTPRTPLLDEIRRAALARTFGGVSGNLAGLSTPMLLQSLGNSADRGTLEIVGDGVEAHVIFQSGAFRYVEVGRVKGMKALSRLLKWTEGEFRFQPIIEGDPPMDLWIPIGQALLEAEHRSDELSRLDRTKLPPTMILQRTPDMSGETSEIEAAILELMDQPTCVEPILDVLPHSDAEIYRSIQDMLDRKLLVVRD